MVIHSFQTPFMRSMTYLVEEEGHCISIDPCELPEVEDRLKNVPLKLDYAILTHEHYDHISGVDWIQSQGIPVYASDICAANLGDIRLNHSKFYKAFCSVQERIKDDPIPDVQPRTFHADKILADRTALEWQGHMISFFSTPGHSQGSSCILVDNAVLFAGDTLLLDAGAELNLLGGSMTQYREEALPRLRLLCADIEVYPGHGKTFRLCEHPAICDRI